MPPPPAAGWQQLLAHVGRTFDDTDQERYLLTRSQDLASQEMAQLYASLRHERDQLGARVRERTQALQTSEQRLQSLLSLSADWIWEQDAELRFTYVSEGIRAATGATPESLLGQRRLGDDSFEADPEAVAVYEACIQARRAFRDFTFGRRRADGSLRYIRTSGEPVFEQGGNFSGYRGISRDVTAAMLAEQKVHELARYDSLTGLPNRNMFLGELDRAMARAERQGSDLAAVAQKLLQAIAEPVVLHGCSSLVTASIGIGRCPADAQDAATLLKHADAAMYLAKDSGKNNIQF
jgi:PAS domain S-box-containing protein